MADQLHPTRNSPSINSAARLAVEHWNATPLSYSEHERYRIYPWLYDVAEFRKHAGERVLEVGCGTGCDLLQFSRHGAVSIGIDITPRHLQLARERTAGAAQIICADARQLPFPDNTFDFVYSHGVIHHSDQPQQIAREILRVLKPGGRLNVHVYGKYSWAAIWGRLRLGRNWKRYVENSTDPVHLDLYTRQQLRLLFAPVQLKIDSFQSGWFLVACGSKPARFRRFRSENLRLE